MGLVVSPAIGFLTVVVFEFVLRLTGLERTPWTLRLFYLDEVTVGDKILLLRCLWMIVFGGIIAAGFCAGDMILPLEQLASFVLPLL